MNPLEYRRSDMTASNSDVARPEAKPPAPAPVSMPVQMPASAEQAARDVALVGVEGRPADAKSGPGLLRLEMLGMLAGLILLSAACGAWLGWGIGATMFVVGLLALLFNPVLGATAMRTADRKRAADFERTTLGKNRPSPEG